MTKTPPKRNGWPLVGVLPAIQKNPLKFLVDTVEKYGDFVSFRMGPHPYYLLIDPDGVAHVLEKNSRNYRKSQRTKKNRILLGDGLVTSDGDFWLRQRRLTQPAFHMQSISRHAALMVEATERMLQDWHHIPQNQPIDVAAEMMKLTLRIIVQSMFHADLGNDVERIHRAVSIGQKLINGKMFGLIDWPLSLPFPLHLSFRRAMKELDQVIYRIINERRRSGSETEDLLSMLLHARDEETGEVMNDQHIHDEVLTIIVAGHETTANALSWTWYLLSEHPEIRHRLEEELKNVLSERSPRFEDMPQLSYTRMVIEESMRLYGPVWIFSREAIEKDEILGYPIPAHSIIIFSPYVNHRHPAFWKDPDVFNPDRFLPEQSANRHRYAYFPFGGGPRQCIGNRFAMMEAQLILATVAQKYRLQLVSGHRVEPLPAVTLRQRYGLVMSLAERK